MANEAIKVQGTGVTSNMRTFTIANTPAITKHSLLFLSGDNTASFATTEVAAGAPLIFVGINTAEKKASDGAITLNCDTGGVWDLVASNAIVRGHLVVMAGNNKVMGYDDVTAAFAASGGIVVGTAMETATAAETIRVDLDKKN